MSRFTSVHKARKRWACAICGQTIEPRETHTYSYAYGGSDQRRECVRCVPLDDLEFDTNGKAYNGVAVA